MTIANDLMIEALARLRATVPFPDTTKNVLRDHLTDVTLDMCPMVHLLEGDEVPGKDKGCERRETVLAFKVRIFVRSDNGSVIADPIKSSVMTALDPLTAAWPHSALLEEGRISPNPEIADNDSTVIDMAFAFTYTRARRWSLDG